MRFLTQPEWTQWCAGRGVPLSHPNLPKPDLFSDGFHTVPLSYPADLGRKVALARALYALVAQAGSETFILIGEAGVFPSSEHRPLFARFRQALGETRGLEEVPGHLASSVEAEDAVSIIVLALQLIWDCYVVAGDGQSAVYISHDEYCGFASRDLVRSAQVRANHAAVEA